MIRVSPPEEEREFPGPQASTKVTLAPLRNNWSAVQPPKAPAPMTTTWIFLFGIRLRVEKTTPDSIQQVGA
jgi:hypothetical protein